jgi:hypothetical protein
MTMSSIKPCSQVEGPQGAAVVLTVYLASSFKGDKRKKRKKTRKAIQTVIQKLPCKPSL